MKLLKELLQFLDKVKPKKTSSKDVKALEEGIKTGLFEDNKTAADHFFKHDKNKSKYLWRLKNELKEVLIQRLFMVDIDGIAFQKNFNKCHKMYCAVQILMGINLKKSALELAEATIKKTIKYEFTDLTVALSSFLQVEYAVIEGDKNEYLHYKELLEQSRATYQAELDVQVIYTDLLSHFSRQKGISKKIIEKTEQITDKLKQYIAKHSSYRLNLLAYNTLINCYLIQNKTRELIVTCQQAIQFFQSKPYQTPYTALFSFQYYLLNAYIQLKAYNEAEIILEDCLRLAPKNTYNYNIVLQQKVILGFFSKKYSMSYEALKAANKLKISYQNAQEQWKIFEAFVYFFYLIGKIEKWEGKKFRLKRFLNDVPFFTRDKSGNSIAILIIEILYSLKDKNYDVLSNKIDSLQKYIYDYLKEDERSKTFIKLLLVLYQAKFDKKLILKKADKHYKKLLGTQFEQGSLVEIVPYEDVWEIVLELLD